MLLEPPCRTGTYVSASQHAEGFFAHQIIVHFALAGYHHGRLPACDLLELPDAPAFPHQKQHPGFDLRAVERSRNAPSGRTCLLFVAARQVVLNSSPDNLRCIPSRVMR